MLKQLAKSDKQVPTKSIQVLDYLPNTCPAFFQNGRGRTVFQRRIVTEEEKILQIMVEELQKQTLQDSKIINEQKLRIKRLKDKLAKARDELEKTESLLEEARKDLAESKPIISSGVQVDLHRLCKPKKKKDAAVQFTIETQTISVQSVPQVDSIGTQTDIQTDTNDQTSDADLTDAIDTAADSNDIQMDTLNQSDHATNSTVFSLVTSSSIPIAIQPGIQSDLINARPVLNDIQMNTHDETGGITNSASISSVASNTLSKSRKKVHATIFKCRFCGYKAEREGHVKSHHEYCKNNPNRNQKLLHCEICEKSFTVRRLYDHLRGFTTGKHNPRGKHGEFSTEYHINLWNKFKAENK